MADCHNKIHKLDGDIHGGIHTIEGDAKVIHSSMKRDLPSVGAANVSKTNCDFSARPFFV